MKLEINDRTTGFLILLAFLLALNSLKPALIDSGPPRSSDEGNLFIRVCGDVKSPGIYGFGRPPDFIGLVDRAGGLSSGDLHPQGAPSVLLSTGMEITVYQEDNDTRFILGEISAFHKITLGIPISVNKESETGLTAIPGVGPELAKAIVQERSERRGFKRLDEVLSVKGVGPKTYKKIEPYLVL
jgi:competence protein ComEA